MKKIMIGLGISALLVTAPMSAVANETQVNLNKIVFNDVSEAQWSYSAVQWGIDNQIVNGYPDGSYKPDQNVTQSEFLAMLLKSYNVELTKQAQGEAWDSPFLNYALENNWTLVTDTNKPITRGQVAKLLTNAAGKNFNVNDSIHFLLVEGLSNGKTERSIDGYKGDDLLSRAEAIAFIKNVKANLEQLSACPKEENQYVPYSSDNFFPFTWDTKPLEIKALYEKRNLKVEETFSDLTGDIPIYIEVDDVPFGSTKARLSIKLLDGNIRNFDYTARVEDIKTAQELLNTITKGLNNTYNKGQNLTNLFKMDFVQGTSESGLVKSNRLSEYTMQDILSDEKKTKRALSFLNIRLSANLPDGKNRISIFMYKSKINNGDNDIQVKLSYVKNKYIFPSSLF